jgi:hypothetical protein
LAVGIYTSKNKNGPNLFFSGLSHRLFPYCRQDRQQGRHVSLALRLHLSRAESQKVFKSRRGLLPDIHQRACADAVKNKLLNSYRAVREAAKQRQREHGKTAPGRSKENTSDINTTSVQAPKNTRTREYRAKAAGTNALLDRPTGSTPGKGDRLPEGYRSMRGKDARKKS